MYSSNSAIITKLVFPEFREKKVRPLTKISAPGWCIASQLNVSCGVVLTLPSLLVTPLHATFLYLH